MSAHELLPPREAGGVRIEREVLSSHRGTGRPAWLLDTSVVAVLLTLAVTLGPDVQGDLSPRPSRTAGASGSSTPHATRPAPPSAAGLIALTRTRCPRVRALRLSEVDTLLCVEIAPWSAGRQKTRGSQDTSSTRFARIVVVYPVTGAQPDEWIQVRCPDTACTRPELLFSVTDIASHVIP
jgi:hypothetical protein